ncbi:hypothetical protein Nmel_003762 [Mimus melanotis]
MARVPLLMGSSLRFVCSVRNVGAPSLCLTLCCKAFMSSVSTECLAFYTPKPQGVLLLLNELLHAAP